MFVWITKSLSVLRVLGGQAWFMDLDFFKIHLGSGTLGSIFQIFKRLYVEFHLHAEFHVFLHHRLFILCEVVSKTVVPPSGEGQCYPSGSASTREGLI